MPHTVPTAPGRALRRRLRGTSCPVCGHPWEEHPGAPGSGSACSECRFEQDHDAAPEVPGLCTESVPPELLRREPAPQAEPERWWHRVAVLPIRVLLAILDGLS